MSEGHLGSEARPLRVAVVGSGPSGFYAVQALFKSNLVVRVDMFDRLPTPYGLVRGGVAPDHQKIKNVIRIYTKIAATEGFRFFGNVMLGRDLQIDDLTARYDQVVLATGNESDRKMGVPGEELAGVYSATEFVGWFNGHPDFQDLEFDLANAKRVAVVGNGNVAMDVARVLAKRPEELAPTDITQNAVDRLETSAVEEIILLGRRGPAQAAFSPKEIKEVGGLEHADLVVPAEEAALDDLSATWLEEKADRDARKNVAYLTEHVARGEGSNPRKIRCRFLVSPAEFLGEGGMLTAVKLQKNELHPDSHGTPRPRGTETFDTIPVDLVFKAIGYRGVPIPGIPFHERWGIIPNDEGRVLTAQDDGDVVPGLYVVGWAKRGPTGLIGTNSPDSQATVAKMLEDVASATPASEDADIAELLASRGVDAVSFADWELLDADEVARGQAAGKLREKVTSIDGMMKVIRA